MRDLHHQLNTKQSALLKHQIGLTGPLSRVSCEQEELYSGSNENEKTHVEHRTGMRGFLFKHNGNMRVPITSPY